jgi:hypothetical protein
MAARQGSAEQIRVQDGDGYDLDVTDHLLLAA